MRHHLTPEARLEKKLRRTRRLRLPDRDFADDFRYEVAVEITRDIVKLVKKKLRGVQVELGSDGVDAAFIFGRRVARIRTPSRTLETQVEGDNSAYYYTKSVESAAAEVVNSLYGAPRRSDFGGCTPC